MGGSTPTGGGNTTSTSTTEPWNEQKPFLQRGFQEAESNVLERPLSYYPDSTVTPFSPQTEQALGAQEARAGAGNPLLGQAQGYTSDVMGGKYLDPGNPYLSSVADSIRSEVQPAVASQFARGGRFGGGGANTAQQERFTKDFTQALSPYAFGAYENERGRQGSAAAAAPGLAREDYFDIGQLADVGGVREDKGSEYLSDSINRFNFSQSEPTNRLAQYMGLVQGNYGGTGTGSSTAGQSANTGLLGSGLGLQFLGGK